MKIYGLYHRLSKVFEECAYWTNNRVLLPNNPNKSRELLNETYGMTEDDKEFFFADYIEKSCADLLSVMESVNKDLAKAVTYDTYHFSYENDCVLYYACVQDNFPLKAFQKLMSKFLMWDTLYYWYWMKGLDKEMQLCLNELETIKGKLFSIIAESSQTAEPYVVIPYNDGFKEPEDDNTILEEIKKISDIYYAGIEMLVDKVTLEWDNDEGNLMLKVYIPDDVDAKIFSVDSDGYLIVTI